VPPKLIHVTFLQLTQSRTYLMPFLTMLHKSEVTFCNRW